MKSILLVFSLLLSVSVFSQEFEVDTVAKPYLADFSKIVHHVPKKLVVENAPEKWKNYPVNSIVSLLELFDNADRFSENDKVWAKAAAESLATTFYAENNLIILCSWGYSSGPENRISEAFRCNRTFTLVVLCDGCKCATVEMQLFMDIFNKKMMELVCPKQ
ncbi:hypothetical protein ACLI1A_02810 [Flavobacterium sp. RHBU_3]|uniref:hypothetical protein n=1 Tax=Flavobacterium sp. RHBU_3 TaxID=3391184 RepID=UPI003984CF94